MAARRTLANGLRGDSVRVDGGVVDSDPLLLHGEVVVRR